MSKNNINTHYILILIFSVNLSSCINNNEDHSKPFIIKHGLIKPVPFSNGNYNRWIESRKTDSLGIPIDLINGKEYYNATTIAQYASDMYNAYYKEKKDVLRRAFLIQAEWLLNNLIIKDSIARWEFDIEIPGYGVIPPWSSAMTQGFGISVLNEAYNITGDSKYSKVIPLILKTFELDYFHGGVRSKWNNYSFYEEYSSPSPSRVLNGFIFSLGSLYTYYLNSNSLKAKRLFDEGVYWLENKIESYDGKFTSIYNHRIQEEQLANAIGNGAGDGYHHLHIAQLLWLYSVTDSKIFYKYALKFLEYDLGKTPYIGGNKIKDIEASSCIDCVNYGTNHLNDGVWTYGKYWSTNQYPTKLTINFDSTISELRTVVFYSTSVKNMVQSFSINDSREYTISDVDEIEFIQSRHFETYVQIYYLDKTLNNNKFQITINGNGVTALREIDLHYNRRKDLEKIQKKLLY